MLSHIEGFSELYIPTTCLPTFPKSLTELFDPDAAVLPYPELLKKCNKIYENVLITADQVE